MTFGVIKGFRDFGDRKGGENRVEKGEVVNGKGVIFFFHVIIKFRKKNKIFEIKMKSDQ